MEFSVKFTTGSQKLSILDNFRAPDGKAVLDIIKKETGYDVDPDIVHTSCGVRRPYAYSCIVDVQGPYRKDILEHPVFNNFRKVKVIVPCGWFGQFIYDDVSIVRYNIDNPISDWWKYKDNPISDWWKHKVLKKEREIHKVIVSTSINFEEVLTSWFFAGMPDYWGITEERHREIILTELACEEERRARKEKEAREKSKQKQEKERMMQEEAKAIKKNLDLEYFASELALMSEKLKQIQNAINQ